MDKNAAAYFAKFNQPVSEIVRLAEKNGYGHLSKDQIEAAAEILFKECNSGLQIDAIDHVWTIYKKACGLNAQRAEGDRARAKEEVISYWQAKCDVLEIEVEGLEGALAKATEPDKPGFWKRFWGFMTRKRYIGNAFKRSEVQGSSGE